jgi:hypothetical protein
VTLTGQTHSLKAQAGRAIAAEPDRDAVETMTDEELLELLAASADGATERDQAASRGARRNPRPYRDRSSAYPRGVFSNATSTHSVILEPEHFP